MPQRLDRILREYKNLIAAFQALKRDIRGIQKRSGNIENRLAQIRTVADQLSPLLERDYDRDRLRDHLRYTEWYKDIYDRMKPRIDQLIESVNNAIEYSKEEWEGHESKVGLESFFPDDPVYGELELTEEEKVEEETKSEEALQTMLKEVEEKKKGSSMNYLKEAIDIIGQKDLVSVTITWGPDETQEEAISRAEEMVGTGTPFELIDAEGDWVWGNINVKKKYLNQLEKEEFFEVSEGGVTVSAEMP